ncbi:hypothetical protein TNCV_219581 [Trichonephila clavipes]|nr:hypothetical protein TNCV_219581 [Trichonephila clavipes]
MVQCVLWLTKFKSVTRIQRRVGTKWNVDPPTSKYIHQWERTLKETGTLHQFQENLGICGARILDENDWIEFMTAHDNKEVDNNAVEDEVPILTADLIRKGLKLATGRKHFFTYDPNTERELTDFVLQQKTNRGL